MCFNWLWVAIIFVLGLSFMCWNNVFFNGENDRVQKWLFLIFKCTNKILNNYFFFKNFLICTSITETIRKKRIIIKTILFYLFEFFTQIKWSLFWLRWFCFFTCSSLLQKGLSLSQSSIQYELYGIVRMRFCIANRSNVHGFF